MSLPRNHPGRWSRALLLGVFFMLFAAQWSCGGQADSPGADTGDADRPLIVTTVPVLYSLTANVAGEDARVENLLPPGASPHEFSVTPEQATLVAEADLVIMNGAGLEPWAEDLVEGSGGDDLEVVVASAGLQLIEPQTDLPVGGDGSDESGEEGHADAGEERHEEGQFDPHVWLDVENALHIVDRIVEELAEFDPPNASAYRARGQEYRSRLAELDAEIEGRLADVPQKEFVAFHSAFQYYARAYGLEQVAVLQQFPGQQPSPRYLADLVDLIGELGITAVFTEPQFSPRPAETLAAETDAEVYEVDPEGSRLAANMYEELMRSNTDTFLRALGEQQ